MREVAGQLVAPMGRVGPDHDRTHQCSRLEPKDELGDVVEQDGDVEGALDPLCPEPRGPLGCPGHHVGVSQP